jgi:hypothetical protein
MMKPKTYAGKPDLLFESDEWKNCGCWVDRENSNVEWFVFFKYQEHNNDWITYKVVANGRVPRKANYWFAKNKKTGQIGFAKDLASMSEHRPNLYSNIMKIISEEF